MGAQNLATRDMPLARYLVPTGPWKNGDVPMTPTEGRVLRRTWRVNGGQTTLQVFDPLRQQIIEQGHEVLFQCHDVACGGFDFRFAIDVVSAPDMAVDLGDYIFLSARGADGSYVTLLVSRFGRANFVQLVEVGKEQPAQIATDAVTGPAVDQGQDDSIGQGPLDFAAQLLKNGHVVLEGLDFRSGASVLAQDQYPSLQALADFLKERPERRVLLVGHTDTVGSLAGNTSISLARAQAVRSQLLERYDIAATRLEAAGAGYLSPLVSNDDAAGRDINRRVEVVLLPPE